MLLAAVAGAALARAVTDGLDGGLPEGSRGDRPSSNGAEKHGVRRDDG